MSSMFLVVYTSAHLIGAVSYPLTPTLCEQALEQWNDTKQAVIDGKLDGEIAGYTFACERHDVRPKVQAKIDAREQFESDCWNIHGGMKNCHQYPNGDVEMHGPRDPVNGSVKSWTIKFKDRLRGLP
ncbi:hypothetical protein [Bradyrhizobium sp. WSM1743]|uniref:hypothetical protein n=1 Tax=Bradyrhizobium sp. WSM1743 TaxID=318996 RepID=UPI00040DC658|nr:hypothetical protein [Bradyrhizobium sp. WSM1743]